MRLGIRLNFISVVHSVAPLTALVLLVLAACAGDAPLSESQNSQTSGTTCGEANFQPVQGANDLPIRTNDRHFARAEVLFDQCTDEMAKREGVFWRVSESLFARINRDAFYEEFKASTIEMYLAWNHLHMPLFKQNRGKMPVKFGSSENPIFGEIEWGVEILKSGNKCVVFHSNAIKNIIIRGFYCDSELDNDKIDQFFASLIVDI